MVFLGCLGTILAFSLGWELIPGLSEPPGLVLHACAYAALTWAVLTLGTRTHERRSWVWVIVLATTVFLLGIAIELAQALVGREASTVDAAANGLGVALGVVGWRTSNLPRPQR